MDISMIEDKKFERRLKTLQFNIDDVNNCYQKTLKDTYIECGIEYNKSYPLNEETYNRLNKQKELKQFQEDKLYTSIFNFTQTYYSIKEFLRKKFPQKKKVIEDFFSNEKVGQIARKNICNDLKHNPEKDLKYGIGEVSRETRKEPGKQMTRITFRETWFYAGIDSVEHCNKLFYELLSFIEENFNE